MKTVGNVSMTTVRDSAWEVEVRGEMENGKPIRARLAVEPPEPIRVLREKHENVPLFQERKWLAGQRFRQLEACECSLSCALLPDSVIVEDEAGNPYRNGVDYYFDAIWAAFGRTPNSRIGAADTVYVSYSYSPNRLGAIVADRAGVCHWKAGTVNGVTPLPPELNPNEFLIGHIFFDRNRSRLSEDMFFPFLEAYSAPEPDPVFLEQALGKTLAKLRAGKPVRILAWGDSVTACDFIRDESKRWINLFVAELRKRFPRSEITLVNLGWPGRAVNTFQCEPPGSPYNYEEKVVESGADLVTLEFVNDAYLTMEAEFNRIYDRVAADFKRKDMEPVIILPHPVRPDWMDLPGQKDIAEDPRPYVKFLRRWARNNGFAIADVSARFLHLWKEGIPYNSLMVNNINHPDARGIGLFAEVLSSLFPEQ